MPTLGTVAIAGASADAAYNALVAACKEAWTEVAHSDACSRIVAGESGMMRIKNRFSSSKRA